MKVIIKVWEHNKKHDPLDGMPQTMILEYDKFNNPKVIGLDVPIERCVYDKFFNCLEVSLDVFPARIDADPHYENINLLSEERATCHPEAYTLLDQDKGKGLILWTNELLHA